MPHRYSLREHHLLLPPIHIFDSPLGLWNATSLYKCCCAQYVYLSPCPQIPIIISFYFFLVLALGLVGHHYLKHFSKVRILLDNFQISKSKAALARAHTLQPTAQMLHFYAFFKKTLGKYLLLLASCN